ncbi:hypothetical protein HOY82DRAFT_625729 [Tuber indicum]|nr:hypothetical protein HOY82DRAFT_625729 [Tuber indicum]
MTGTHCAVRQASDYKLEPGLQLRRDGYDEGVVIRAHHSTGVLALAQCIAGSRRLIHAKHVTQQWGTIQDSDDLWVHRMISQYASGAVKPEILIQADNWTGFEAAHIFLLEDESHWIECGYGRWITDMDDAAGSSKINSSQNGILLQSTVHDMFNSFLISINPDDGYKVCVFDADRHGIDGRILDSMCRFQADTHRDLKISFDGISINQSSPR